MASAQRRRRRGRWRWRVLGSACMGSPPAAVSRRRCRFHRVRSAPVQSSHSRQHARHRASRCVNKNGTIWQRVVSPPSCSASPTLRSGSAAASHRSRQSEDHAGRRRGDSGRRGCAESGLAGVPPAVWPLAAPCAENCGRRRVEAKRTAASLVCRRVRALRASVEKDRRARIQG